MRLLLHSYPSAKDCLNTADGLARIGNEELANSFRYAEFTAVLALYYIGLFGTSKKLIRNFEENVKKHLTFYFSVI